jgi:N-acetylglucosamine kinase-like BadF-type ATPase
MASISTSYDNITLCIEGGGSKTLLQAIDGDGRLLDLFRDKVGSDRIFAGGSNINTVGPEGVKATLMSLFKDVKIGEEQRDLNELIDKCKIVAAIAGVGNVQNHQQVKLLFEQIGFKDPYLTTDAAMALSMLNGRGASLIAGTGSICLGTNEGKSYRVGGLGYVLGDEGSGYQMGKQALQVALAEEYEWGDRTTLTAVLRNAFMVDDLKTLIPAINRNEIPPAQIASLAPLVCEEAQNGDLVARTIIENTAHDLRKLVDRMLKISKLANCQIHLYGGLFKSVFAELFINTIELDVPKDRKIVLVNRANENPALLYARDLLSKKGAEKSTALDH